MYGYSSASRFDVFFCNQLLVFQQHQDESLYDSWIPFKDIIRKVLNHGLSIWTLIEILLKHLDSLSCHIINLTVGGDLSPESTTQTLPSFEEYTPPVTYPEDAEETLGTPMEVEPLEKIQLEDLGLNTCNHNIPLSSREVPSFDESKPQPKPLANFRTLDVSLGDERGPQPPIKPHSPDSFRMKVVKPLTIHTPPSPHVASFHPKDMYCYYRPCIDDPKKHYGFKPGLLGHSGSPCVDFVKLEMTEDDWELESKEISFLGRGLNSPVRPKEVEKIRIKETHKLEHKIQQILFQHMTPSYNNGVYRYLLLQPREEWKTKEKS
ncbi:hypothetical protein Tco_0869461, partial [Tanacetum coccineum]